LPWGLDNIGISRCPQRAGYLATSAKKGSDAEAAPNRPRDNETMIPALCFVSGSGVGLDDGLEANRVICIELTADVRRLAVDALEADSVFGR